MTLTTRQREIFTFAYDNGYYSWPKKASAKELAKRKGISRSTFLEHLRKAEEKIVRTHKDTYG